MDESSKTTQYNPPDKQSILEYINPQGDVVNIVNNMLGLQVTITKDIHGKINSQSKRISKPEFTKEYIMSLASDLNMFLNFTVQISKFDYTKVQRHMLRYMLALEKDLATHGDDNYISNNSWQKILSIHYNYIVINNTKVSGWHKFGIDWAYDKAVDYEMLHYVKDFHEEVDQTIKFDKILATFSSIIEASINKSSATRNDDIGMLLMALGEMRTESTVLKEKEKEKKSFFQFGKQSEKPQEEWK